MMQVSSMAIITLINPSRSSALSTSWYHCGRHIECQSVDRCLGVAACGDARDGEPGVARGLVGMETAGDRSCGDRSSLALGRQAN